MNRLTNPVLAFRIDLAADTDKYVILKTDPGSCHKEKRQKSTAIRTNKAYPSGQLIGVLLLFSLMSTSLCFSFMAHRLINYDSSTMGIANSGTDYLNNQQRHVVLRFRHDEQSQAIEYISPTYLYTASVRI